MVAEVDNSLNNLITMRGFEVIMMGRPDAMLMPANNGELVLPLDAVASLSVLCGVHIASYYLGNRLDAHKSECQRGFMLNLMNVSLS